MENSNIYLAFRLLALRDVFFVFVLLISSYFVFLFIAKITELDEILEYKPSKTIRMFLFVSLAFCLVGLFFIPTKQEFILLYGKKYLDNKSVKATFEMFSEKEDKDK